ncbi:MAG TPA: methyltransferase domain-containing protein [Candidatus Dormibacteraeota bacterium]|nr:methyltransferase domain-containing protein [Candidatus Dormibacteraeota bacterium]
MRVRDDPLHPDPGFAELYAALPDADDLFPWLDWCRAAAPPVLYLGIGTGRLAVPLHRAGIELVGVDAHPDMLARLHAREPGITTNQALIATLQLRDRYDLVIGPSSILTEDENLATAVRHLKPRGRVGMELMNPHWLASDRHDGVRLTSLPDGSTEMEVDYHLPDGSVVVQVVDNVKMGPWPEDTEDRLDRFGLTLVWMGSREDELSDSPTYFVLAALEWSASDEA